MDVITSREVFDVDPQCDVWRRYFTVTCGNDYGLIGLLASVDVNNIIP